MYESDKLFDADPPSPSIMDEIIRRLPQWPSEGGEYKPVLEIINVVRSVLQMHRVSRKPQPVYDNHDLGVYDREMLDGDEGGHPVKLDLILTRLHKLGPKVHVEWPDVDVAIEVKSHWPDLVT